MKRLLLAAAAVLAAGCNLKPASQVAQQDAPYAFPHAPHVEGDVACAKCHAGIEKATQLDPAHRQVQLPADISKNEDCSGCHDGSTAPAAVSTQVPKRSAPYRFSFSHADHLAKVKGDCKVCHRELPDRGDTRRRTPPMATCTGCHKHQQDFVEARCTPCHVDLKGYKPESAFAHQGDWLRIHGALAKPVAESCSQCHDQTYCATCHAAETTPGRPSIIFPEQVERAFIHRGDYVSRHMIDERANPGSCRKCHGSPFCQSCHELQGVSSLGPNARDPHPQGWANNPALGKNFHGNAARRDIASCAGCHDNGAQAICASCHRVGGIADTNPNGPHTPSFVSKHRSDDRRKNAMCLYCHPN